MWLDRTVCLTGIVPSSPDTVEGKTTAASPNTDPMTIHLGTRQVGSVSLNIPA